MRHRDNKKFSDEASAMVAELPPVVDADAPLGEVAVLGRKLERVGAFHSRIGAQQREDLRRLREMSEQPTMSERERAAAEARVHRLLDAERALEVTRTWWNRNRPAIRELLTRAGGEGVAREVDAALPPSPSAEWLEARARLRQLERDLQTTRRARLKRRVAGALGRWLKRTAKRLEDWGTRKTDGNQR